MASWLKLSSRDKENHTRCSVIPASSRVTLGIGLWDDPTHVAHSRSISISRHQAAGTNQLSTSRASSSLSRPPATSTGTLASWTGWMLNRFCLIHFRNDHRALHGLTRRTFCYSSSMVFRVSNMGRVIEISFVIVKVGFRILNERRIENCTVRCK